MSPSKARASTDSREVGRYHDDSSSASGSLQNTSRSPTDTLEEALPHAYPPQETPVWMRKTRRLIPNPIAKSCSWLVNWCKGPNPPKVWRITPLFPKFQLAPIRLLDRYAPKRWHRVALLGALYFSWLLCFITILNQSQFTENIPGYGEPTDISCTATFWSKNNGCGVDGADCRPFQNDTLVFRCPSDCAKTQVLNPYAVGDQVIVYQPEVIGGPRDLSNPVGSAIYRGDSFICSAAIQAGFITDSEGGCGVVSLNGSQSNFPAVDLNGIKSVGFNSNFPLAYRFLEETRSRCKDLRWPLLAVTIIFTVILGVFTNSAPVFFWSEYIAWFWHVALVSDPPSESNYWAVVSDAFMEFLPATFIAYVVYRFCCKPTLSGLRAPMEKSILWIGPLIVGCLDNYTFDKIPIQRLTAHDLKQQPGAVTALVIIVLVIVAIAVGQAWAFRMDGRMPKYLALYLFMAFCILMALALPTLDLRIHHYILALLLLPGTAIQTRPSLVYQGLLLGLFINGVARWGFASVLQTPESLQGDALLGSDLPMIHQPIMTGSNITFTWDPVPSGYDGMSIIINDVERYRGYVYDGAQNFTWMRDSPSGDPEYFRFGFMEGSSAGDYSKAGTWQPNGDWVPPPSGATR